MRIPTFRALVAALLATPAMIIATGVATAPSAHAAGSIAVYVDDTAANALLIDARAAATRIDVFYNTVSNEVEFSSGQGFASWPEGCTVNGTGLGCPGAAVDQVTFVMSEAADEINLQTVCIPLVLVAFGGGDDYYSDTGCQVATSAGIDAGAGNDRVYLQNGPNEVIGGAGNDEIVGGPRADLIQGGGGDDYLVGGDGGDRIEGGDGNDQLNGTGGNDTLKGDAGNDTFGLLNSFGGDPGANDISGGPGRDILNLRAEEQGQRISLDNKTNDGPGGGANYRADLEEIQGTQGDDVIVGTDRAEVIDGYSGDDVIDGRGGNDEIDGNYDNDRIKGGSGKDRIVGGSQNDTIVPGSGADDVWGDDDSCTPTFCALGADTINVRDGSRDRVHCGPGADQVRADRKDLFARGRLAKCERVRR